MQPSFRFLLSFRFTGLKGPDTFLQDEIKKKGNGKLWRFDIPVVVFNNSDVIYTLHTIRYIFYRQLQFKSCSFEAILVLDSPWKEQIQKVSRRRDFSFNDSEIRLNNLRHTLQVAPDRSLSLLYYVFDFGKICRWMWYAHESSHCNRSRIKTYIITPVVHLLLTLQIRDQNWQ